MLSSDNFKYGYNAATGNYEDLMAAGIIDPTKVSCFIEGGGDHKMGIVVFRNCLNLILHLVSYLKLIEQCK